MTLKEIAKTLYNEVVFPSMIGSSIAFCVLSGGSNFAYRVNYSIGDKTALHPNHSLIHVDYSTRDIDTDNNGTLDTRVFIVPRGGIVRRSIESQSI